jgi:hypothetical protein
MLQVCRCWVSFHHLVLMLSWGMLRMILPCWERSLRKTMQQLLLLVLLLVS